MPDVDGYKAAAEVRRYEKEHGGHTPIIALTANAISGDRERCLAAGMDDYLCKPFKPQELFAVLRRWVNLKYRGDDIKTNQLLLKDEVMIREVVSRAEVHETILTALQELNDPDDPTFISELIDAFVTESPGYLSSIRSAATIGDTMAIGNLAHTLKSSSASIGAVQMSTLCQDLEKDVLESGVSNVETYMAQLEAVFQCVKIVLSDVSKDLHEPVDRCYLVPSSTSI